ncbi:MAG: hypothetical protein ABI605_03315 [Rhizobacter sp.]
MSKNKKNTSVAVFVTLVFTVIALVGCGGGGDGTEGGDWKSLEADLTGTTSDSVNLQFHCVTKYIADIQASDEGKATSVRQFLTEAASPTVFALSYQAIYQEPTLLGTELDKRMLARTESAPSTKGLFSFKTTCDNVLAL